MGAKLWAGKCRTHSSDQRVEIEATGLFTNPDLLIICEEPKYSRKDKNSLVNPQVIFEVLSPSTELYDRSNKFEHYKQIPSLTEYVLVSQNRAFMEPYVRQPDQTRLYRSFEGLDQEFELTTVSVAIPMAEIFAGVELSTAKEPLRLKYPDADLPGA